LKYCFNENINKMNHSKAENQVISSGEPNEATACLTNKPELTFADKVK
jgi:hypothetical protein